MLLFLGPAVGFAFSTASLHVEVGNKTFDLDGMHDVSGGVEDQTREASSISRSPASPGGDRQIIRFARRSAHCGTGKFDQLVDA